VTGRKLPRIYLSPPHIGSAERGFVAEAFDSNWVAPLGPNVDAFEVELAEYTGTSNAVALSSGTAGLHLALLLAGVERGDVVLGSDLTFVASANAALYVGAEPVFIDSERESWNLDPALLADDLRRRASAGRLPAAVVVVHVLQVLAREVGLALLGGGGHGAPGDRQPLRAQRQVGLEELARRPREGETEALQGLDDLHPRVVLVPRSVA